MSLGSIGQRGRRHADFADALRLVRRRRHHAGSRAPGGTEAVAAILGLEAEKVAQACEEAAQGEVVSAANINGGGQVVIAGSRDAVARAGERAKALGARRVLPLPVSAPFHCALMKPAETRLTPELRALATQDPRVPVAANVDAEPIEPPPPLSTLIAQVSSPVRWEAVVNRLRQRASQRMLRWVLALS
jgi:[acyl-carrier-protein] S-malonyltransferase